MKKAVIVAVSGGRDSQWAGELLLNQGWEVYGLHLRMLDTPVSFPSYPFPVGVIDVRDKFHSEVIDYFIESYKRGITPNPCIICNLKIKYSELARIAQEKGIEYIATGHYARIKEGKILRANNPHKDQSYFLCALNLQKLPKILLPLGEETSILAPPPSYRSSQEVCFLK